MEESEGDIRGLCVAKCKYKKGFVALLSCYLAFLQRAAAAAPVVFSGAVGEYTPLSM